MTFAHERNGALLRPMRGIAYRRVDTVGMDQARQASSYLRGAYPNANALILGMNGILDRLAFLPDTAEAFEQALMDLGLHLGFRAQRPEKEAGVGGLDVLWGIGERQYLLLPCKNGATAAVISKDYTDEISGSVNWFISNYDHTCSATPVMIHPSMTLASAAAPPPNMRVVTAAQLDGLRAASRAFALAVKDRLGEVVHVRETLHMQKLLGSQVVQAYTVVPKRSTRAKKAAAAN